MQKFSKLSKFTCQHKWKLKVKTAIDDASTANMANFKTIMNKKKRNFISTK